MIKLQNHLFAVTDIIYSGRDHHWVPMRESWVGNRVLTNSQSIFLTMCKSDRKHFNQIIKLSTSLDIMGSLSH